MNRGKLPILGATMAVIALALSACGSSASHGGNAITLYNGQHRATTEALVANTQRGMRLDQVETTVRSN